jgi:hypothetical protein
VLKRHLLLPCLLIVSALALAACGGSGNSDESQIEEAVETSATSTDPANCTKLSTQGFMEQSTQTEGPEAVKSCEEEASEDQGAEAATVSNIEVEGSKATAEVAITGGGFDGQAVEVSLVKEGDQWKLDEIAGFANFDKARLIEAFEEEFAKPSSEVSEGLAACLVEAFERGSQAEFEELLLSRSAEGLEELAEACA